MSNVKAINRGFSRAIDSFFTTIDRGMVSVLKDSMNGCIEKHDDRHPNHTIFDDGYGWALCKGGNIEREGYFSGGESSKLRCKSKLHKAVGDTGENDTYGIVLAAMGTPKKEAKAMSVRYEIDIIKEEVDELESKQLEQYFSTK